MKQIVGIAIVVAAGFGAYFLYQKYVKREEASKPSEPQTEAQATPGKSASRPGMGGKKPMSNGTAKNKAVAAQAGQSAEWKGVPYR